MTKICHSDLTSVLIFQVASCPQCLNVFHLALDHRTERLSDAETRCRSELAQFSEEISIRQNSCRVNSHKLEKTLGELQHQFDAATANIAEIHQAFISMLEKKRDHVMEELATLHSKQVMSLSKISNLIYCNHIMNNSYYVHIFLFYSAGLDSLTVASLCSNQKEICLFILAN